MIAVPDEVLVALGARFGIPAARLVKFGGGQEASDGVVYAFAGEDGAELLKILPVAAGDPDGLARIQERLRFVRFLGERGVNIVHPLAGAEGRFFEIARHDEQSFIAYKMKRIRGGHPAPREWTPDFISRWGREIGKLHQVTQEYPLWRRSDTLGANGRPLLGWEEEWLGFYDWCPDAEVKEKWVSIRERLEKLPIARDCFGFTHNDPHIDNLIFDGEQLTLLDFDVANYHWFISDVAIALQAVLFARAGGMERPVSDAGAIADFLRAFWAGYRQENALDPFWPEQLDLFIHYRRILLFTAMQGWLENEPVARSGWKEMILAEPAVVPAG